MQIRGRYLVIVIHTFGESAEVSCSTLRETQLRKKFYTSIKQSNNSVGNTIHLVVLWERFLQSFLGDTMIFHANIVHKSNANNSDRRRWALLISYNTKENESSVKHHHASYEKIDVVRT